MNKSQYILLALVTPKTIYRVNTPRFEGLSVEIGLKGIDDLIKAYVADEVAPPEDEFCAVQRVMALHSSVFNHTYNVDGLS
jgi:hypothetical protein